MHLSKPEVDRCFFESRFDPALPAMELCWDPHGVGVMERQWRLPDGVVLTGPAPERFGVSIHRTGADSYQVRMLWNRLGLSWEGLTRSQIMATSLPALMQALGTELWYLLNQPVEAKPLAA